ncbi:MAG: flagellin [Clostridia bacterium]|nr:flagellin [Clostridia bacterium]
MRINQSISSLYSYKMINANHQKTEDSLKKLASGLRITAASDDAAGLAISQEMNARARGLAQANSNTNDGISMIQTADGALNETHSILQNMRELAVKAQNPAYGDNERQSIQAEMNQLTDEITRISENTQFNTKSLLNGDMSATGRGGEAAVLQTGADSGAGTEVSIEDMGTEALGLAELDVTTAEGAAKAVETIDGAISAVSSQRSSLGATQNRLEHTSSNLGASEEAQLAAESRITDMDMAKELIAYTLGNIRERAAEAMQAQANVNQKSALQFFLEGK